MSEGTPLASHSKQPESPNGKETQILVSELSDEAKLKMEAIQSLVEAGDRSTYVQMLKEAAAKLSKSVGKSENAP